MKIRLHYRIMAEGCFGECKAEQGIFDEYEAASLYLRNEEYNAGEYFKSYRGDMYRILYT